MNSTFGKLNLNDWWKSLLVAIGTAIVATISQMINTGHFPSTLADLKIIGIAVLSAVLAYLGKNLTTNGDGKPLTPEGK